MIAFRAVTREEWLHRGMLLLAWFVLIGTAIELTMLRHWDGLVQLIPWVALAVLAVGLIMMLRPTPARLRAVRVVAVVLVLAAAGGMTAHVVSNYLSGPLDARYASRWAGMSFASRLWASATGGVGPSPILAPGVFVQAGLALLFAAHRHPSAAA